MTTRKSTARGRTTARKNSEKNSERSRGPRRDDRGRLSGGNPGNSGGKKGRSGRKPLAWKAFCRDVLHNADVQEELLAAARDRETHGYAALIKVLAGYAAGLPVQTVRLGGLMSVAQRVEGLSDAELERYLKSGDQELLEALVTAADEDEEGTA